MALEMVVGLFSVFSSCAFRVVFERENGFGFVFCLCRQSRMMVKGKGRVRGRLRTRLPDELRMVGVQPAWGSSGGWARGLAEGMMVWAGRVLGFGTRCGAMH